MDLKELDLVDPESHWYYQSKLAGLDHELNRAKAQPSRIIDVGAGSGFFSLSLASGRSGVAITCIDPNYESDRVDQKSGARFLRFPDAETGDLYLFIDVLEHVPNDRELLATYTDVAEPGAFVLISVPAFMSLWSGHDVFLEHFRRYRLSDITTVARSVGLEIISERYLFGSIFLPAWALRRVRRSKEANSDLKASSGIVNNLLRGVLTFEHRIVRNRIFGLSAVVLARVPLDREGIR